MRIQKIIIENYRGISIKQEIPLLPFTTFVGKNDSGKSIVLNALATFLDPKEYPIVKSDFNDLNNSIKFTAYIYDVEIRQLLENLIKSKLKKSDGLDSFLDDLLFADYLIFEKVINQPGKNVQEELLYMRDFKSEEFQKLYQKTDEELSDVIKKNNISIPAKGRGRNSKLEKIKYIKEYCYTNHIEETIRSVDDEYKISTLLPSVEMFESDYGIKTDTTFKTNSVSEIQDYFDRETKDDSKKLNQIEHEIQSEMTREAESIKKYMLDYTSTLKKVEIIPSIVWKDAIKSVDVKFQFENDNIPIPMSHKGSGYRRLFMVARFRYLAEKNKSKNIIYLIEEPETFLHPSAQEDLLNAFKELSHDSQILITSHSPVFAASTSHDGVILCRKDDKSYYEYVNTTNKNDFIMGIVEELGIKPSYNLRDHHEKILFVESKNDASFYDLICRKVLGNDLVKNRKILVLPYGGGEDIESFLNIDYFDNSGRKLFLIIDSDKHKGNFEKQLDRSRNFKQKIKSDSYVLKKSCIENYYHPRAIEKVYSLEENTFDFINDDADARLYLKTIISDKDLKNIKEKNNFLIFEAMSKTEWEEVLEVELIQFLQKLLDETTN